MDKREELLNLILQERERQVHLPGSEFDLTNGPNDWVAIATKYLSEESKCKGLVPSKEKFQDKFVKAGAVILAALEYIDHMEEEKRLK